MDVEFNNDTAEEIRRYALAVEARLDAAEKRAERLERENENLRGDIYLFGIGEITKEQLIGLDNQCGRAWANGGRKYVCIAPRLHNPPEAHQWAVLAEQEKEQG